MQRINKQMQREISLLLELRVKNEMAKNAVITEVDCSKDLKLAKVYFTTIDPAIREDVQKALTSVGGLLRSAVGKQLALRQTPALSFHIDDSEEYGRSIDALLDSLNEEETEESNEPEEEISGQE